MSVKNRIILITVAVWLVGVYLYAYVWVRDAVTDPGAASYERGGLLPLLAFIVNRGIYIFAGGLLLMAIELILFGIVFKQPSDRITDRSQVL